MSFPESILPDLMWWRHNITKALNDIKTDNYNLEIYTDASLSGSGACCRDESTHGWWKESDRNNHINFLKLQAIFSAYSALPRI